MFFIIPIGHEGSTNRRFPVVTLFIVVVCLVAFALTWPRHEREQGELEEAASAVVDELSRLAGPEHGGAALLAKMMAIFGAEEDQYGESAEWYGEHEDSGDEGSTLFGEALTKALSAGSPQEFLEPIEAAIVKSKELEYTEEEIEPLKAVVHRFRTLLEEQVFLCYGLVPGSPKIHAFLTHMFLHGGYMHLIFNILFFLVFGPTLEDRWGRFPFATVYLLAGFGAAFGYMVVSGPSSVPMIGASGAIAGMMGAFLVEFTHTQIRMGGVVFLFIVAKTFTFSVPAWVFLPFWIGWEIVQGLHQLGSVGAGAGGVAHWAHIAGFAFGCGIPYAFRFTGLDKKLFPQFEANDQGKDVRITDGSQKHVHDAAYRRGVRFREDGDWIAAADCFEILVEKYPDLISPRLELAETYRLDGEFTRREEVLLGALELAVKNRDRQTIPLYTTIKEDFPRARVPAECLFRVGTAYENAKKNLEAVECFRKLLKAFPDHPLRIKATIRLANLFAGPMNDLQEARTLLVNARKETSDPLWRQEVERELQKLGKRGTQEKSNRPGVRVDRTLG